MHTNSALPVIPQNDLIVAMGNEEDTNLCNVIKSILQNDQYNAISDVSSSSHTNKALPVIPQNDLIVQMGNEEDTTVERGKALNFIIFIAS